MVNHRIARWVRSIGSGWWIRGIVSVVLVVGAVACDRGGETSDVDASGTESAGEATPKKENRGARAEEPRNKKEKSSDERARPGREGGPSTGQPKAGGAKGKMPGGSSGEGGGKSALPKGTDEQQRLLAEAKGAFMRGQLEEAKPKFQKVVETGELTGTQASAYIALGQIYIESGEPQKAADLIESVPEEGQKIVEMRLIEARAHAAQEQWEEAASTYEEIVDLQPNYLFVYTALGEIYTQMGEKKKAAKTFKKYENKLTTLARTIENPEESEAIDRINALDLFSAANDERAHAAVRKAFDDPKPRVRAKAAVTAGQLGLEKAKGDLEAMAETEKNKRVKRAASRALQKLERSKEGVGNGE